MDTEQFRFAKLLTVPVFPFQISPINKPVVRSGTYGALECLSCIRIRSSRLCES